MCCCESKGFDARRRLLQVELRALGGRATSCAEAGACRFGKAAEAFPVPPGPPAAWLVPHPFVPEQRSLKVKNNTDPCSVINIDFQICSCY